MILGPKQGELFCLYYDISDSGNWEGHNILNRTLDVEEFARRNGIEPDQFRELVHSGRQKLLARRAGRVRPGLDDKVLASWNGLMLTALTEAGFALSNAGFIEAAKRNAHFICSEMVDQGRLKRSWKEGASRLNGYLEDYAHVVEGLLTLFQVTGETVWMEKSIELTKTQLELFLEEDSALLYFTASDHESLLVRPSECFDNATPSGNSTTACNLLTLAELTGDSFYRQQAQRLIGHMQSLMSRYPSATANWLRALDNYLGPVKQVVIVGEPEPADPLVQVIRENYLPRSVLLLHDPSIPSSSRELPLLQGRVQPSAAATAFVCEDSICLEPVSDPAGLKKLVEPSARTE